MIVFNCYNKYKFVLIYIFHNLHRKRKWNQIFLSGGKDYSILPSTNSEGIWWRWEEKLNTNWMYICWYDSCD